jgi:hypothetical protein
MDREIIFNGINHKLYIKSNDGSKLFSFGNLDDTIITNNNTLS